jgi:hypothetical protein
MFMQSNKQKEEKKKSKQLHGATQLKKFLSFLETETEVFSAACHWTLS